MSKATEKHFRELLRAVSVAKTRKERFKSTVDLRMALNEHNKWKHENWLYDHENNVLVQARTEQTITV